MAWRRCFSFSLCLVTLSCLVGVVTEQLVFDEERSRVCKGVDALFASGNASRDRECSSDGPSCLTFECEFEIAKLVPLEIELEIVPCASTRRDGRAVSVVHIRIYDDQDTLVLDAPAVEENSTFVTEHINGTVIIKENITVIQRQEGIVFGILLLILPPSGVTTSVTLYDPISIRIACEPPPSSASPPPSSASPPPSSASPPPAPRPPASSPPPPTSPPPTVSSESLTVGLAAGVPTVVVLIVIIVVMWLILMVVCIVWRRSKQRSGQSNLRYRYNQEETSKDASKRYTDLRVPSHPMFHHRLPVPPDEKEEEEEETYDEINIMRPAYGVTSIEWNYVQYNTSRSKKDEAWVYPRNKLTYLKDISQGQYAKIMLMEAQNIANVEGTMPVIVKALCSSEKLHQQSFDKELQLRKTYHHQSIVSLLGVCTDTVGLPMMVIELMDYGDLLSFVKAHGPTKFRQAVLDYDDFYKFASDISSALEYLSENGLVHGGVAAENCLVGRNLMVKLTGFSSVATATQDIAAEEEEETYYFTLVAEDGPSNTSAVQSAVGDAAPAKKVQLEREGLLRWKAPETVVYGKSTTKSDVWSFGVLLWEMTTYGSVPHADLSTNDVLQNAMQETLKLTLPTHCPEDFFKVIASCQRSKPVDRPSFKELFGLLSVKADKTISGGESCLYEL